MRNESKKIFMGVAFISLIIVCLFTFIVIRDVKKTHQQQLDINQKLESTIRLLQQDDIQELLSHVRKVMAGEVVYEWEMETGILSPLAWYSFNSRSREIYPTMYTIESELVVLEININDDSGEMKVFYSICYLDSSGKLIYGNHVDSSTPTKWILERQNGVWVIVKTLWYKEWVGLQSE